MSEDTPTAKTLIPFNNSSESADQVADQMLRRQTITRAVRVCLANVFYPPPSEEEIAELVSLLEKVKDDEASATVNEFVKRPEFQARVGAAQLYRAQERAAAKATRWQKFCLWMAGL